MTRAERLRLAKAARELAYEFAEGRGPELQAWTWCGCAAAAVVTRAGLSNEPTETTDWRMPAAILDLDHFDGILTDATRASVLGPDPGAVVFPLLWLADELEATS